MLFLLSFPALAADLLEAEVRVEFSDLYYARVAGDVDGDGGIDLVIYYYNGVTESWETGTSVIEVYFEGDSTVVDHDCVANVDAFVHVDGGPMEGMFFYLAPSDGSFEDGYCDQGSDYSGSAYSNIYFAELQN